MTEKFITPAELPSDHARELLTILIEECAEVQQRATKALRFGLDEIQPGQPFTNAERLAREIGDVDEMVNRLVNAAVISPASIDAGRENKKRQLATFLQTA